MSDTVLFETHPLPMFIMDAESLQFLAVNDAAIAHYGYSGEEFLSMTAMEIRPAEDIEIFKEKLASIPPTPGIRSGGPWRHKKKDGAIIFVEVTHSRIEHKGRRAFLVLIHDVTERTRYEEALRQSMKMEAVGRLAGGVAHDFNNMLTIILGYCNLTLDQLPGADPLRSNIEGIRKAAERAALLTRQMLAFSRRQVLQPRILDLNEIITDISKMIRRLIGENIELVISPDRTLHRVKADPSQIEQILMNLIVNSRDAMPDGGRIVIETRNVELDENYTRRHAASHPGGYAMIAVTDNGMGMDAKTTQLIFEPFFTTKTTDQGTGLGLATVYGIVKQSGGNIWVYSEPGQGTTFKIYLPVVADKEPREKPKTDSGSLTGTETVLLVEDESELRILARDILKKNGYRIIEAVHGEDALAKASQHHGPIHLMISDVMMPKLGGQELARRLKSTRKETKVIFMSGYASDAVLRHGVLEPGAVFIEKPFTGDTLMQHVRRVLDGNFE